MQAAKRYYPTMGLVRYIMAFGVLIAHYNTLTFSNIPFFIGTFECVGGFFALSGFLMYPSFIHSRGLRNYIGHRMLRIMPSYWFTVLICALGLVFVSSLSIGDYFSNSTFWKYLASNLCFLNWLEPDLPGVFQGDEYYISAVDGSLWTMKVEWCLYLSVPVFFWFVRRFRQSDVKVIIAVILASWLYRITFSILYDNTGREIYNIIGRQFFGQLSYFYCGMLAFIYSDFLFRRKVWIAAACICLYACCDLVPFGNIVLAPVFISGFCIALSMLSFKRLNISNSNNLSYNVYLMHFPVIQLSVYFGFSQDSMLGFAFSVGATLLLAFVCNRLIEKPINVFFKRRNSAVG